MGRSLLGLVLFALLTAAGPILGNAYGAAFRVVGSSVLTATTLGRWVRLGELGTVVSPDGDKVHVVVPPTAQTSVGRRPRSTPEHSVAWVGSAASGLILCAPVPHRAIGYVPSAVVAALVLVSPLSLRRRARALVQALAIVQAYVALRTAGVLVASFQTRNEMIPSFDRRAFDHLFELGPAGSRALEALLLVAHRTPMCHVVPILVWAWLCVPALDTRGTPPEADHVDRRHGAIS